MSGSSTAQINVNLHFPATFGLEDSEDTFFGDLYAKAGEAVEKQNERVGGGESEKGWDHA